MNKQAKAPTYKVDDHSVQRCQSCDGTKMDDAIINIATKVFDKPSRPQNAHAVIPLFHAGKVCDYCGCKNFWVREFTAECGNCNAAYQIKQ